jgi:hypothetical protein
MLLAFITRPVHYLRFRHYRSDEIELLRVILLQYLRSILTILLDSIATFCSDRSTHILAQNKVTSVLVNSG